MALKLSIGSKKCVGIDIGSSSIKVIEISNSGHKYYIDALDVIDLPSGTVNGGIINDPASAASYLKSSLAKHGISEKKVIIGIPCKHVIIKTIEMPKMKPAELESSIYFEAQRYITYDMNEVSLDYVVTGDSPTEPSNNTVMIIAGKKDIIENQSKFFNECGLNPYIIDVDCIALENMFNFNYPEEFDELIAIVKIGASETNVHIIQKETNLFRRDIPIGGITITEEIAKKFQIDFNEAENLKTGNMGNRNQDFKNEFNEYMEMILSRIISEIHRTIDYFAANNDKHYPKKIYLTGGSSMFANIVQEIENKINIPVSNLNTFRNLLFNHEVSDDKHDFFGVAVGLAIRGAE